MFYSNIWHIEAVIAMFIALGLSTLFCKKGSGIKYRFFISSPALLIALIGMIIPILLEGEALPDIAWTINCGGLQI
jgi:hypothetical protein